MNIFYDFSAASKYRLTLGVSGITFTGINPGITFPLRTISDVQAGGLRLVNQTLELSLFSKKSFTVCVVIMQLWLNRSISIKTILSNGAYGKPHLIYDSITKNKLQANGFSDDIETSIPAPNSFNGKRVALWLTKKGIGRYIVKASISICNLTQQ